MVIETKNDYSFTCSSTASTRTVRHQPWNFVQLKKL